MKIKAENSKLQIFFLLLVMVSFFCNCTCNKENIIKLCNNYSVKMPAGHFMAPTIEIPRFLEKPQGVIYTFYSVQKKNINYKCGITISNYYYAMNKFLPDSIEYWPDNFGHPNTALSDTLWYSGYTLLPQATNGKKANKKTYWKIMIVRNPVFDTGTGAYLVGYYGVPQRRKKCYEALFSTTLDVEKKVLLQDWEPLFDSLVIQKWYHTIF